jgi:hypothetical protein
VSASDAEDGAKDAGGLAALLVGLLERNLERDPSRRGLLRGGVVVIAATDAEVAVRLELVPGLPRSEGWPLSAPVQVEASSATLLELSAAPLRFGLPDVLTSEGRDLVGGIVRRRIRVRGLVRHVATVRRLTMLLSAR